MKINLKTEFPLFIIVALPFLYLAFIWNDLPKEVPLHWNIHGEIDRYGDKSELWIVPFLLPLLTYGIFLIVPYIDPKQNLNKMGKKFNILKFVLTAFMSVLALYVLYVSKTQSMTSFNGIVILIGALYVILGNYFKTLRANYFIGIRTPWTLEDEDIWKKTHEMAGKLWFIGGMVIILCGVLIDESVSFKLFLGITIMITIIPVISSYLQFRKKQSLKSNKESNHE